MAFIKCIIEELSIEAYERVFAFLYENKIPAECDDVVQTIEIGPSLAKITFGATVVLTSEMGDTCELDNDEFYKITII